MGKGKKTGKGPKQNAVDIVPAGDKQAQPQELQRRNVVQEEGSESEEDKRTVAKDTSPKQTLGAGSDSEEDNAAAGGRNDIQGTSNGTKPKTLSNLQPKRKNKAAESDAPAHTSPGLSSLPASFQNAYISYSSSPNPTQPSQGVGTFNSGFSTPSSHPDSTYLNHDSLGRIIVRLLPAEYLPEVLPDGRYIMTAASIGYLAQKLGH